MFRAAGAWHALHSGNGTLVEARACIFGCLGTHLTPEEVAFFAEADPWGFILFARNIETPRQVRALTHELRDVVGREAPILIDQEGGRVARLRGPHWQEWSPALEFCESAGRDVEEAMFLRGRMIAEDLQGVGIDVNCAPILDVLSPESHSVVADRCYGSTEARVVQAGRALAEGQMAGGVLSVAKHIPGHGRARVDSHEGLPIVDAPLEQLDAVDFAPFRALCELPMGMTAHIVYSEIDDAACATMSPRVIGAMRGMIGFDGLLMTDDLSMHALSGPFGQRAKKALAAGCDVILHCNGEQSEMEPIAANTPRLAGKAAARADAALAMRRVPDDFDRSAASARLSELLGEAA